MTLAADAPTLVGLGVALFGAAILLTPAQKLLGSPERLSTRMFELLFLWALAGLVVAILLWWEGLPLSSIGLRLRGRSVLFGLLLATVFVFLVSPFLAWMIGAMGLSGFERGLAKMADMPLWFLLLAAVMAGVVEETVYRGYAIERLAAVLGSYWWAGLIATMVWALMHLPMWGRGPLATFFVSGGLMALFYIWTRDLLACIVAHAVTDAVGFLTTAHTARIRSAPRRWTGS